MAIGRISGSMLKSNLTRNGVDLAFETNILYLDVTNARVGIGTSEPSSALQVVGTITTNSLTTVGEDSTLYGLNISGNNISTVNSNSDIVLNPSGTGAINASASKIINVANPTSDQHAATKQYVDDQIIASGSGTVVSITAGTGLTASPSNPITTSGTISIDPDLVVARVVGDDSTGTDLRVGETIKIAGSGSITTAMSGDILTISGPNLSSYLTNSTVTIVGDDSTGVTLNSNETIKIAGGNNISTAVANDVVTITGATDINVNSIASADSSAVQINDNVNVSGTFNAKTIVTNDLISEDSTAINVLDGLSLSGNIIYNVSDPVSAQDAATKNYVDNQLSGISTTFYVADDASTVATIDSGDTLRIIGSGGITTAVSGDTLTIVGSNPAQGLTFIGDDSTGTAIPDGGALQIVGGLGIDTAMTGNVLTITNTSTQLEIDGGSAYSIYNAISEGLIDGGTA